MLALILLLPYAIQGVSKVSEPSIWDYLLRPSMPSTEEVLIGKTRPFFRGLLGTDEKQPVGVDDREKIIRLILAEAGSQGEDGMRLVASIINNRSKYGKGKVTGGGTEKNPTPYVKVISADNQFEGWKPEKMKVFRKDQPKWKVAEKVTDELLAGDLKDVAEGTLFFANPKEWEKDGQFKRRVKSGMYRFKGKVKDHNYYDLITDKSKRIPPTPLPVFKPKR